MISSSGSRPMARRPSTSQTRCVRASSICLWCSRVARAGQAVLLGPFPPRALPRLSSTTGRSATHRAVVVVRHLCFASTTHPVVRPRWASPVPTSIRFPTCHAHRPRRSLQRSRQIPRLLLPSRSRTRSASTSGWSRGSIASLALWPVGRSVHASPYSLPRTSQDSIAAGWLDLDSEGIPPPG